MKKLHYIVFLLFSIIIVLTSFAGIIFTPYFTAYGTDITTTNSRVAGGTQGSYCYQFSLSGNSQSNGLGMNVLDVEYRFSGFTPISGVALLFDIKLGDIPILPNGSLVVGLMYNGRQITSKTILIDSLSENNWKTISIPFGGTIDEVSFVVNGNDTTAQFYGSVVFNIDNILIQKNISGDIETLTSFEEDISTDIEQETVPTEIVLAQNYPNPFNPVTVIKFMNPESGNIKLTVYDILGREVATLVNEYKPAGNYEVKFNAAGFASGTYLYVLQAGNYTQTKKMILLK